MYAIPRAELSGKTANFSRVKRGARARHVVFTWRILLFVFLHGLLAVPPEDMNLEDAPLYCLLVYSPLKEVYCVYNLL